MANPAKRGEHRKGRRRIRFLTWESEDCGNAFSSLGLGSPCKHGSYTAFSGPRVRYQGVAAAFQIRLVDVQGVGL